MIEQGVSWSRQVSPRRGFTLAGMAQIGPVVVGLDDSSPSHHAVRAAVDIAMTHSIDLVILDRSGGIDPVDREHSIIATIMRNPHVHVVSSQKIPFELLAETCTDLAASMLVLNRGEVDQLRDDPGRLSCLLDTGIDILMLGG